MDEVRLTIPLIPPSVNRYVRHTRSGRHFVTKEAIDFKETVALIAKGQSVDAKSYEVEFTVFLGMKQRGDVANFEKMIGDGLVYAGVIKSDDWITDYHMHKRRDRENPRTEIHVKASSNARE